MAGEKLLDIEPQELSFQVEVRKQASCTIRLSNNSPDQHVAFKVLTTHPKKYGVRPNIGILSPGSTCDVIVSMQALKEVSPDMQCNDKFMIKSSVVCPGDTVEQCRKLFKEKGHVVEDHKLRVAYVLLPSLKQSSDYARSGERSSLYGSKLKQRNSKSHKHSSELERSGGGSSQDGSLVQENSLTIRFSKNFYFVFSVKKYRKSS